MPINIYYCGGSLNHECGARIAIAESDIGDRHFYCPRCGKGMSLIGVKDGLYQPGWPGQYEEGLPDDFLHDDDLDDDD